MPSDPARPERTVGRSLSRIGVLAVIASFVGIWGYVMWLTFAEGRADPPDRMEDTEWAEAAEAACAPHRQVIDDLPFASEVRSPEERADLLDAATDELELLVADLEVLRAPRADDEALAVERWLADYRTYLEDRRRYAEAQRDPDHDRYDAPFSVTDRGGHQIDVLLDDFARINHMESCEAPNDV